MAFPLASLPEDVQAEVVSCCDPLALTNLAFTCKKFLHSIGDDKLSPFPALLEAAGCGYAKVAADFAPFASLKPSFTFKWDVPEPQGLRSAIKGIRALRDMRSLPWDVTIDDRNLLLLTRTFLEAGTLVPSSPPSSPPAEKDPLRLSVLIAAIRSGSFETVSTLLALWPLQDVWPVAPFRLDPILWAVGESGCPDRFEPLLAPILLHRLHDIQTAGLYHPFEVGSQSKFGLTFLQRARLPPDVPLPPIPAWRQEELDLLIATPPYEGAFKPASYALLRGALRAANLPLARSLMLSIPWLKPEFGPYEYFSDAEHSRIVPLFDAALKSGRPEPVRLLLAAYPCGQNVGCLVTSAGRASIEALEMLKLSPRECSRWLEMCLLQGQESQAAWFLQHGICIDFSTLSNKMLPPSSIRLLFRASLGLAALRTPLNSFARPRQRLKRWQLPSLIALCQGFSELDGTPCWLPTPTQYLDGRLFEFDWKLFVPALFLHKGPLRPFLEELTKIYSFPPVVQSLLRAEMVLLKRLKPAEEPLGLLLLGQRKLVRTAIHSGLSLPVDTWDRMREFMNQAWRIYITKSMFIKAVQLTLDFCGVPAPDLFPFLRQSISGINPYGGSEDGEKWLFALLLRLGHWRDQARSISASLLRFRGFAIAELFEMMLDRGDQFDFMNLLKICIEFNNVEAARIFFEAIPAAHSGVAIWKLISPIRLERRSLLFAQLLLNRGEPMALLKGSPVHFVSDIKEIASALCSCPESALRRALHNWPFHQHNEALIAAIPFAKGYSPKRRSIIKELLLNPPSKLEDASDSSNPLIGELEPLPMKLERLPVLRLLNPSRKAKSEGFTDVLEEWRAFLTR